MAAKRKPPVDVDALVAKARAVITENGGIPRSKLGPAAMRDAVANRLQAGGFEATPKAVRKPLEAQLRDALASGAAIPLKAIASHVGGATAAEAKKVAVELVRQGEARLVLRGKVVTLFPRTSGVLSREALDKLAALSKLVQAAL